MLSIDGMLLVRRVGVRVTGNAVKVVMCGVASMGIDCLALVDWYPFSIIPVPEQGWLSILVAGPMVMVGPYTPHQGLKGGGRWLSDCLFLVDVR